MSDVPGQSGPTLPICLGPSRATSGHSLVLVRFPRDPRAGVPLSYRRIDTKHRHCDSSSRKAFASFKSSVSKPSVNQS